MNKQNQPSQAAESPARRAHGQRNREKLLVAAANGFRTAGLTASLEAIAKEAGVGIGTLYRHFPNREALLIAVYEHEIETLAGDKAGKAQQSPFDLLNEWFTVYTGYLSGRPQLAETLRTILGNDDAASVRLRHRILSFLETTLAQVQGLRPDVAAEELFLAATGIGWTARTPAEARRLCDLLLEGLKI